VNIKGTVLTQEKLIKDKLSGKKIKPLLLYPFLILHRFVRIWPTYMVALLVFWQILQFTGDGPNWFNTVGKYKNICDQKAW
jgi:hypothetical protein